MATLEELRRLLASGGGLEELKVDSKPKAYSESGDDFVELEDFNKKDGDGLVEAIGRSLAKVEQLRPGKYAVNADGKDAMLKFGKWNGRTLTHIYKHDPSYLDWMLKERICPQHLADVIRYVKRVMRTKPFEE